MKLAKYAAVAISIAAAIPTGGSSLFATSLLSTALGTSVATASAIAAGVSAAASIGAGLLAKKPTGSGSQTQWSADPNGFIPIKLGRTGGAGQIVYRKGSGDADKNKYETITTILSGVTSQSIDATYADRTLVSFTGTAAIGSPYANRFWEDRQIGLCPEPNALNTGVGNKPGWTAAHKLSGLTAVQDTFLYDAKGKNTFTTEPQMIWVGHWALCYDAREDSTYPGGSGSQRKDDRSTWQWSNNPYVVGQTWVLGWMQNGVRVAGVGIDNFDFASFVEAAEIADLNNWTCGGEVTTGDDKWEVLKQILQAGGGEPIRDGATLSCIIQAPRVSIATIGAGDLVGKASIPRSRPRKERINGIVPKYRSEAHFWEQVSGSVARIDAYVAPDRGKRTKTVEYPLVQVEAGEDASQPTQLAGYDVEMSRELMPIVMPLKLRWIGYRTGDCIDCGITQTGLVSKQLIIIKRGLDAATGTVTLTVRTEDPDKHARVFALTGDVPPTTVFERPALPGDYAFDLGDISTVIANSFPIGLTITANDDGTVDISDHTRRYTDGWPDVAVTGATLDSGGTAGDFFAIGYDDYDRLGGAVTYQLFANDIDARVSPINPGRHYVGYFTVPTAGSGSTGGGGATPPGGACVTVDTPVMLADGTTKAAGELVIGDRLKTRDELTLEWGFYPITAIAIVPDQPVLRAKIAGKELRATPDHLVLLNGEWVTMSSVDGAVEDGTADVVKMTVARAATYVSNDILSHNLKAISPTV